MAPSYDVRGKKILVVGLARSGFAVAKLLMKLGAEVTVNDKTPLDENEEAKELLTMGAQVVAGEHPLNLLDNSYDLIVKNPGIPYTMPLIAEALKRNLTVITEIELATSVLPGPFIGITGTNGKTTTSELTAAILREHFSKENVHLAGNIGIPLSEVVEEIQADDQVVLELSSFQLMGSPKIHPHIAVITNIYSAHLDYHGSQNAYEEAKLHITENQTSADFLIYNEDIEGMREKVEKHSQAQLIPFSRKEQTTSGAYIKEDWICFKEEKVLSLQQVKLPGLHNLENVLTAVAVAKLSGVSNEAISRAVNQFHGVKHRTQFVKEVEGRKYYNDSKATNTQATIQALRGFSKPLVLIAGGLDRGNDMKELVPEFKKYVKTLICFGQTKDKLAKLGHEAEVQEVIICETVSQAVQKAAAHSEEGDIILLSPANASWDQYHTFEERGDDFIQSVETLTAKEREL